MALLPVPAYVADSIYDIAPQSLRSAGVRLVLCDLDNTLTPYEESLPSPALQAWKKELEAAGILLYVVSNSRKSRRCPDFCKALGVPYVRHAGKPIRRGFRQAVMVGDQIFTDVWGANRAGIRSILVKPLAWGKNPLRKVRYAAETPFRILGKRK